MEVVERRAAQGPLCSCLGPVDEMCGGSQRASAAPAQRDEQRRHSSCFQGTGDGSEHALYRIHPRSQFCPARMPASDSAWFLHPLDPYHIPPSQPGEWERGWEVPRPAHRVWILHRAQRKDDRSPLHPLLWLNNHSPPSGNRASRKVPFKAGQHRGTV